MPDDFIDLLSRLRMAKDAIRRAEDGADPRLDTDSDLSYTLGQIVRASRYLDEAAQSCFRLMRAQEFPCKMPRDEL